MPGAVQGNINPEILANVSLSLEALRGEKENY